MKYTIKNIFRLCDEIGTLEIDLDIYSSNIKELKAVIPALVEVVRLGETNENVE